MNDDSPAYSELFDQEGVFFTHGPYELVNLTSAYINIPTLSGFDFRIGRPPCHEMPATWCHDSTWMVEFEIAEMFGGVALRIVRKVWET